MEFFFYTEPFIDVFKKLSHYFKIHHEKKSGTRYTLI